MAGLRSNVAFRRLFAGRLVTNAGDSLYGVAAMWLVYDLTGSSLYTGLAGFLTFGPQALQFLTGPLVDRWSVRRVLVGTQFLQGVGVLLVPAAAAVGRLNVWLVLGLMPVLTLLNQFVYPAQHAVLPRIVDDDRLVRANSLFALAYQGTDLAFNALAGVLVAAVGATALYLVDAATFAAALVLFAGVVVPRSSARADEADGDGGSGAADGYLADLRAGVAYLRGSALVAIVAGGVVANFGYGVAVAVLPAFAASLGGSAAYGLLMAALAGGSFAGAAGASAVEDRPVGRLMIAGWSLTAVCWFAAVAVAWLPATVPLLFAAFVPVGATNVVYRSMQQSAVDEDLLGRVSSVTNSASTAMMPVGSLLGGAAAGAVGARPTLAAVAAALGFLAVYYLARPGLRSLPPAAEADEAALGLRTDAGADDDPARTDPGA